MTSKADYHKKLCEEFHQIYLDKNDDYGDAFSKLYREVGFLTGYTKIADKFYRIQALNKKGEENRKIDETIRDSLMDMANYCMLTVMEMDINARYCESVGAPVVGGEKTESKKPLKKLSSLQRVLKQGYSSDVGMCCHGVPYEDNCEACNEEDNQW